MIVSNRCSVAEEVDGGVEGEVVGGDELTGSDRLRDRVFLGVGGVEGRLGEWLLTRPGCRRRGEEAGDVRKGQIC